MPQIGDLTGKTLMIKGKTVLSEDKLLKIRDLRTGSGLFRRDVEILGDLKLGGPIITESEN